MTDQAQLTTTTQQIGRFGVIGHPVSHSRSPAIHQHFARQTGIALQYDKLEAPVDQFEAIVQDFFASGGRGLNVTVPFKQRAWQLASAHLSPRARLAEAVNTLWIKNDVLHGCNTDGAGLVGDLARLGVNCQSARILLIGAGGAARGVIGPLLETGCKALRVVNRTPLRATELVTTWLTRSRDAGVNLTAGGLSEAVCPSGWDVVINASASSLGDAPPDLPAGLYAPCAWAYDMMYSAQPTPFMQQARRDGAQHTADGLGMLVTQAAVSFEIWHGVTPAIGPVIDAIRAQLDASLHNVAGADKKQP
jgi:shikimate dehydrogenase